MIPPKLIEVDTLHSRNARKEINNAIRSEIGIEWKFNQSEIRAELSGLYAPSPGTIYPALTMLEEMGFANVTAEGARKLYTITDAGLAELESNRVRLDAALERLRNIGQTNARERPTPILRAMENLKLVLRMRSDSLTQKQIIEISDIIDAAAKQIERL